MLLTALALCAALPTPQPVAVVVRVVSSGAPTLDEPTLVRAATDALARLPTLTALTAEQLAGAIGRPLGAELRACGADTGCIASRLSTAGVAHAALIVANLEVTPPLVSVTIVDAGAAKPSVRTAFEIARATPNAIRDRLIDAFESGGHAVGGSVIARVQPTDALVSIEETLVPAEGLVVPAGTYRITATADGRESIERSVVVESRQTLVVDLALDETSAWSTPWPWLGIGAGVVVTAVALGVLVGAREDTYQLCLPTGSGDCMPRP